MPVDYKDLVGTYPSLTFDKTGKPSIAYFKSTGADLRLATYNGAKWTIKSLDTKHDVGRSVSLARKPDGYLAAAYEDHTAGVLRYIEQTANGWKAPTTIDAKTSGVAYISLVFDPNGRASVSYQNVGPADLKYAALKNGKWIINTVASTGSVGFYSKLVFSSNGVANLFYYDKGSNLLMKASGMLGSFSSTQLTDNGGKFIAADNSPIDAKINISWLDSASGAMEFEVVS
jgi:hypothetical protein